MKRSPALFALAAALAVAALMSPSYFNSSAQVSSPFARGVRSVTSDPSPCSDGWLVNRSDTNKLRLCNDAAWANVGDMTNPMSAAGDIIYGGASGTPTRLAKGSDGHVLTLASGVPSWAAASGGGSSSLEYRALLTQAGTDAPTATVTKNTLGGTVVWTRVDTGIYKGTLSGAFTLNKTSVFVGNTYGGTENMFITAAKRESANEVLVYVQDLNAGFSVQANADAGLSATPVWIVVDP